MRTIPLATPTGKEIIVVEVPLYYSNCRIESPEYSKYNVFECDLPDGSKYGIPVSSLMGIKTTDPEFFKVYPCNILGPITKGVVEFDCSELVEKSFDSVGGEIFHGFKNYSKIRTPSIFNSSTDSFLSLLESYGTYFRNKLGEEPPNKKDYHFGEWVNEDYTWNQIYSQWQSAEESKWVKALIIEKIKK